MLKIILNRLKHKRRRSSLKERQASELEEAQHRRYIFNLTILCEKYFQHQQDLYYVFIDLKRAFGSVWHAALLATMKKYNISANLIRVIKNLYDKATSTVLFNRGIGDWL